MITEITEIKNLLYFTYEGKKYRHCEDRSSPRPLFGLYCLNEKSLQWEKVLQIRLQLNIEVEVINYYLSLDLKETHSTK